MLPLLLALSVGAAPAAAHVPGLFETLVARVPELEGPMLVTFAPGRPLDARKAIELVLAPAAKLPATGPARGLRARWAAPNAEKRTRRLLGGQGEPGEALELSAQWRVALPPLELLAVLVKEEVPAGTSEEVWLLLYRNGTLADAALLAANSSSEAGSTTDEVKFFPEGRFSGHRLEVMPVHDVPGVEQLEVRSLREGRLDERRGRLVLAPPVFQGRAGRYLDQRTGEVLLLVEPPGGAVRVLYQGRPNRPWQELGVDLASQRLTVHFPGSEAPYQLELDEPQAALSCTNPDHTVQRFVRAPW